MKPQWNLGEAPCETTEKRRRSAHAESSMFCTSRSLQGHLQAPAPNQEQKDRSTIVPGESIRRNIVYFITDGVDK